MKKSQNKVAPQATLNRVPAETKENEGGKKKASKEEEKRPGSAISREFMPKKQQKIVNQWKRNDSQDDTTTKNPQGNQSVQTPFGYVPFKSAPNPIYGNRANPNGTATSDDLAVANYMQNAYQKSPQLQRPDSVMTGTDMNTSRPGSELGIYRLPSRYQSYTTLPRPEHVQMDIQNLPVQQQPPHYGIPKAVSQHGRTKSMERSSNIYGTSGAVVGIGGPEKRPLSAISGSRSMHTIHTEPYMPRVGSKAFSFYGLPYDDESSKGLKPIIPWKSLNAFYLLQSLIGIGAAIAGVSRLMLQPEQTNNGSGNGLIEIAFGASIGTNGLLGLLSGFQQNYSVSIFTFIMAFFNFLFTALPFQMGAKPFLQLFNDQTMLHTTISNYDFALLAMAIFSWGICLVIMVYGCRAIGRVIYHVENIRLQNAINKSVKDIHNMNIPA
uniref:Uncharacterized protein n=1 Tax=Panagrolaimus davidi TaxID=227884 RepID=A0A914PQS5_9BILA